MENLLNMKIIIAPSSFAVEDTAPLRLLESAGFEVLPNPVGRRWTEEEAIRFLAGVDGLIAGLEPLNRRVLGSTQGRLKALARVGIGMTNVDQAAAAELGIRVSSTPGGPSEAVAEMTLAALLALLRELPAMNSALHAGQWTKTMGRGMRETTLLIVGYGRIGRAVARHAKALGATIHVFDPFAGPVVDGVADVFHPSLEEALAVADAVSLHASGDKPLLGPHELARLKHGAILLNSARGELVDEGALVEALERGQVAKAWFDAFWQEPYQGPLTRFPQVLLTPHAATYTRCCRLQMETEAANNLIRDLRATAA
jgi:D-3-phosphoglycerate dehydrogenase / 2-oxoglutarate reductase